jgi:hypothetical protein
MSIPVFRTRTAFSQHKLRVSPQSWRAVPFRGFENQVVKNVSVRMRA